MLGRGVEVFVEQLLQVCDKRLVKR
jgi:hypothetical protein